MYAKFSLLSYTYLCVCFMIVTKVVVLDSFIVDSVKAPITLINEACNQFYFKGLQFHICQPTGLTTLNQSEPQNTSKPHQQIKLSYNRRRKILSVMQRDSGEGSTVDLPIKLHSTRIKTIAPRGPYFFQIIILNYSHGGS